MGVPGYPLPRLWFSYKKLNPYKMLLHLTYLKTHGRLQNNCWKHGFQKTSILTNSGSRAKMDFSGNATAEKFKYTTKWSSSTKRMLDLVFYKVTPLFFLMPRIRLYKMLFHLIYLKTSVLYKMLVEKYRFQKTSLLYKVRGARSIFCTFWGPKTLLYRGSTNP